MKRFYSLLRQHGFWSSVRLVRHSLSSAGWRTTLGRIRAHLRLARNDPRTNYESDRRAQAGYVRAYARSPLKGRRRMLEDLLQAERGYRGVILYPASYRLEMRQRPEHLLAALADQGWLCLMLTIGGDVPYLRRHGPRLYATNLYEDALAYYRQRDVVLYLTFPGHLYVAKFLQRAYCIYDVLDRMQIFADFGPAMVRDHRELLQQADLVLCSAPPLFEACSEFAKRCLLVPNGVYPEHFASVRSPAPTSPVVVGYYGAISELLDFDLLEAIADLPEVELALAGPVVPFDRTQAVELQTRTDALFARRNVRHHGVVEYEALSGFMQGVHCALVPFLVNADTDAVSPLKLFEYLAAGKPVLATPTRSVQQYAPEVFVGDAAAITARIRDGSWRQTDPERCAALLARHTWPALLRPIEVELEQYVRATAAAAGSIPTRPVAPAKRVDIINISFFDWNGETPYKGGAERYVRDLAFLCQRLGCSVRILQNANFAFTRRFEEIEVIGVPLAREVDFPALSRGFAAQTSDADLVIASPLELACRFFPTRNVIGINHGIHWDTRTACLDTFSLQTFKLVQEALQRTDACVCVDTNFINWVRSFEWRLARQLQYVPNYVDPAQFRAVPKDFYAPRLTVLYPRRLYDPRGFHETLDAFEFLLHGSDALELHLCGQANGADAERARRAVARHGGKLSWYELGLQDVHKAYEKSHIVLVPTMYAEGTSLSCIEGMATNNAVIATNVGGLPNLVLDGFNGLLVRPDTWDIAFALRRLLEDRDLAAQLARNALEVSATLHKERWEQRWTEILGAVIHLPADERPESLAAPTRNGPTLRVAGRAS